MLERVALVAVLGFLAGAVAAWEPWRTSAAPRPDPAAGGVGTDVVVLARLRWLDEAARCVRLGATPR